MLLYGEQYMVEYKYMHVLPAFRHNHNPLVAPETGAILYSQTLLKVEGLIPRYKMYSVNNAAAG